MSTRTPKAARRSPKAAKPRAAKPKASTAVVSTHSRALKGTAAITHRGITAVTQFFESLDSDELTGALETSDDPRATRLLAIMNDTGYADRSMAVKCRAAGIAPREMVDLISAMHKTDAQLRVARRMPKIAEAMADASMPHVETCWRCGGKGQVTGDRPERVGRGRPKAAPLIPCTPCRGSGELLIEADKDMLKLSLEVAGLAGTRGPLVAQQFNNYGPGSGGGAAGVPDMADWARSSDAVFEGQRSSTSSPKAETQTQAEEAEVIEVAATEEAAHD